MKPFSMGEEGHARPRRSATNATKAWAALIPTKKINEDGVAVHESTPPVVSTSKKAVKKETIENVSPARSTPTVVPKGLSPKRSPDTVAKEISGQPALSKEKLASIEQMTAAYMNEKESADEFEYERISKKSFNSTYRGVGDDDDDDEDYCEPSPKLQPRKRGRPLGSKNSGPSRPKKLFPSSLDLQQYARPSYRYVQENRPLRVLVRQDTRPYPSIIRPLTSQVLSARNGAPKTPSAPSAGLKEFQELSAKRVGRVAEGETVGRFNDILDEMMEQLQSLSEDRVRMRRYYQDTIDHVTQSKQSITILKDNRIAQLESLVSKLSEANTRLTLRLGSAQLERLDDKPAPERASREPVDSAGAAAEREALGEFDDSNEELLDDQLLS